MIQFADQNQILYTTTDNEAINIDGDVLKKYNCSNDYINKTFGLITFKSDESDESDIPNIIPNITKLNQNFFKESSTLTSIDLPLNCEIIGESEFEDCVNLITYTPPSSNTLKEIEKYAFKI